MCVIAVVDDNDARPTREQVQRMWNRNDHGGGVAWQQDGLVRWQKGIDSCERMEDYALTLPVPFVLHFRIASVGPKVPLLTHPFILDPEGGNELAGATLNSALFHNGTWNGWASELWKFATCSGLKIPKRPWSDSRAIAYIIAHLGEHAIDFVGETIAVIGVEGEVDMYGSRWSLVDGFYVSNTGWNFPINNHLQVNDTRRHWAGYSNGHKQEDIVTSAVNTPVTTPLPTPVVKSSVIPFVPRPLGYYSTLLTRGAISKKGFNRIKAAIEVVAKETARINQQTAPDARPN